MRYLNDSEAANISGGSDGDLIGDLMAIHNGTYVYDVVNRENNNSGFVSTGELIGDLFALPAMAGDSSVGSGVAAEVSTANVSKHRTHTRSRHIRS